MLKRRIMGCATAIALAMPGQTFAGSGEVAAGIIGGIIGGAIVNQQRQQPRATQRRAAPRSTRSTRSTPRSTRPSISTAQRQENREVQTALNYFGFDAGGADGILGRRSRGAISSMEAFLAFPPDGRLTPFERDILLGAHRRAVSGNPDTLRLISTSPLGARAALQAQKDVMMGTGQTGLRTVGYPGLPLEVSRAVDEIAASSDPSAEQLLQRAGFVQLADLNGDGNNDYILDTSYSGSSFWCSAERCKSLVFVSTAQGYARNELMAQAPTAATFDCLADTCRLADGNQTRLAFTAPVAPDAQPPATVEVAAPAAAAPATHATALPNFGAATAQVASLSSHCGKVNLLTATRGGFVTLATGGDNAVALAEQFCLARNFAIDTGEQMVANMPGTTMDMVRDQCAAFGPAMTAQLAALSGSARDDVLQSTSSFVLGTGMTPDQLRTTATLCLSAGYSADNMDVALGSAMLLVSLGSAPHAELLGHHLQDGFGTAERPDLARPWFDMAIDALKNGVQPIFAPNQSDRTDLLIWAATGATDAASASGLAPAEEVQVALPTFTAPLATSPAPSQ
ncbi:MAG: peptidoglycan-binding domain-containing protein [Pseudomonadota bacterium]